MRRSRRLLFAAVAVLCALAFLEVASLFILGFLEGRFARLGDLQAERDLIAGEAPGGSPDGPDGGALEAWNVDMPEVHVLHPYLGFVQDPERDPAARRWSLDEQAGELGFPRNFHPPLVEPTEDTVTVAVLGGSVARQIGYGGNLFLQAGLSSIPRFAGRDIRVLAFGLGGYKQPQQLMTLSYLLALGAPIDVVINIDGFNEIVLPVTENVPLGVNPVYPRGWAFRVEGMDPEERSLRGEITLLQRRRQRLARLFTAPVPSHSATANLMWRLLDRVTARAVHDREAALVELRSQSGSYQATGPASDIGSRDELYHALVELWFRSSLQMARLAAADGIEYYHFLQPNQYDPGSKALSPEERRQAWDDAAPAREPVAIGYPLLRDRGRDLQAAGVAFTDLSTAFLDVPETVYIDRCCHYNEEGIRLVADRIVEAIARGGRAAGDQPPETAGS